MHSVSHLPRYMMHFGRTSRSRVSRFSFSILASLVSGARLFSNRLSAGDHLVGRCRGRVPIGRLIRPAPPANYGRSKKIYIYMVTFRHFLPFPLFFLLAPIRSYVKGLFSLPRAFDRFRFFIDIVNIRHQHSFHILFS